MKDGEIKMIKNKKVKSILTMMGIMLLSVLAISGLTFAQVTITVWDWHYGAGQLAGDAMEVMDAMFAEKYPDVKINHVGQPHTPYYEIWLATAAAQEGPDIVMMHADGAYLTDYRDSLLTLDDYVAPWMDDLSAWNDCRTNKSPAGELKGVPFTIQGLPFYWNKQLFTQAGLDPDKALTEWNDFIAGCDKLKAAGINALGWGNKEGWDFDWYVRNFMATALGLEGIAAFATGETKWTDPRIVNAISMVKYLHDQGYFTEGGDSLPLFMDAGELFYTGQSAIMLGLTSDIYCWKDFGDALGPENLGVFCNVNYEGAPYKDAYSAEAGMAWTVTSWSANPQEAVNYIKFMTSAEAAVPFVNICGGMPPSTTVDVSKLEVYPQFHTLVGFMKNPLVPYYGAYTGTEAADVFMASAQLMFAGQMTPEEVAEATQEAMGG